MPFLKSIYLFECYDNNRKLKWSTQKSNVVVNEGLNDSLDKYFKGSSYTASWYMGLKTTGTANSNDTLSAHPSWNEITSYSGNRPQVTFNNVSNQSINNSSNKSEFLFTSANTIQGAFLCTTSSGTSGILYGVANLNISKDVLAGDTLLITVNISAVSDGSNVSSYNESMSLSLTASETTTPHANTFDTLTFNINSSQSASDELVTSGEITHGVQLANSDVGYWALGVSQGDLQTQSLPGRGYWRGDTPLEFVPNQDYVYNNNANNYGGIVPSGGLTIDGYDIAAGTYVCQFMDFSAQDFYMSGTNSFVFRGCRGRSPSGSVGFWNCAAGYTGELYVFYTDMGGNGSANTDFHEIPMKVSEANTAVAYRNRASFCTTAFQLLPSTSEIIENYITDLTDFGNGTSHLNGLTFNGGQTCNIVKRNHIAIANTDSSGRTINQTDCISYFQDFGTFPGTGTNRDGSNGYIVDSNYVGGTGYCIYAGKNAGSPAGSVQNMVITNTYITTSAYLTGGFNGPIAAEPPWGSNGCIATNNIWYDGPNQDSTAFGS